MQILKGVSLELHELQEKHLPTLFQWRNMADFMALCTIRRNTVSLEEFRTELDCDMKRNRHVQFMIIRKGEYIGTLFSYNLNRIDGHVFVTTYMAESWRERGYGAEATLIFLEYLFREYNLYKVYAEVYSYNPKSFNALVSGGFIEEARFRGHRIYNGERHDLIRMSLFRNQLGSIISPMRKLTKRDPLDWI